MKQNYGMTEEVENLEGAKVVNVTEDGSVVTVEKQKWYKSIGFWIGIAGVILTATGHSVVDLKTWGDLWMIIIETLRSPATLIGIIGAVIGVLNSTGLKGFN